ncbi:MAG: hypothetical protein DBX97_02960 [Collinsella tanakaei]|nr:MAG: hypothetical protein DBX97_02960 [Collinsella tanakaei]
MREERNGLDDTLSVASTSASVVKGAVKTGKAIAAATKGASVGGPYGAVAGAVWGARKHLGTIAIVLVVILLLPVLFIVMLPSIIFGSLFGGGTDGTTEPIMNDNAAIIENNNEIAFAINQILGEGIDDVTQRIADDFSQTSGDNYEIINPYADDMVSNTNAFIGQYCAAKNEDWENISLSDLEQTLRAEISDLYTFSRTSETRTIPDYPDTEEDESGTETWYIYTIVYQGEAHFADEIFHLTDEQKELADNYAQNLSLFLGDGMFQSTTGNVIPSLGDVRFSNGAVEVVYYNQYDERYANKPYGTDNIGGYGCGPTSMAIVVSSLTDDIVDPIEMAKWSYDNGYWCSKSGSYHALIPAAAKEWGLPVEGCSASEPQRIVDALAEGKLVVALMTKGHFTSSGHFIVLRGVEDEKILVADPASTTRSQKSWDLSIIVGEASKSAAAGGPFWIIG